MAKNGKRQLPHKKRPTPLPLILAGITLSAVVIFGAICALRYGLGITSDPESSSANSTPTTQDSSQTVLQDSADQTAATSSEESDDQQDSDDPQSLQEEDEEESQPITVTITAVGDCTIGSDPSYDSSGRLPQYVTNYGYDYFFSNVVDVFAADDLTIINFEGTLTTSTSRVDKTYAFKGDPSYTAILTGSSIEACNLANNHSHDYGSSSFTDTQTYLEEAGLITFGYDSVAVTEVNGVQVGLVGIYELAKHASCAEDLEAAMESVKELGAEIIIVSFHWGNELDTVPTSTQISLAHQAVDLGANLVIGHHPHVLQGIEEYNGVNICYSLGNFCFGGSRSPSDYDTIIYQQTFTIIDGVVQLDLDVNIIPCSVSSTSSYNDYCPTIATGTEATRILEKLQARSDAIG